MSGEAINFFNNFSDFSYKKKFEENERKIDNNNNRSDEIKIYNKTVQSTVQNNNKQQKSDDRRNSNTDRFIKKAEHIKSHFVEIGKIVDKYTQNPQDALKDESIKAKIEAKDAAEIKELLTDKVTLGAFLAMASSDELSGEDIAAGLKEFKRVAPKSKIDLSKYTTDDIEKMNGEDFAALLKDLKKARKGMKSGILANIAGKMMKKPHRCKQYMSIVNKRNSYADVDVEKAISNMDKMNDETSLKYIKNMNDLERIKDKDSRQKYKGSTIVNIASDMTSQPKAANAILNTAKKEDMDDIHLAKISGNLVLNPKMIASYEKMLGMKSADGSDRFSKENLLSHTDYMVDKNAIQIETYSSNVAEYASDENVSGSQVTEYSQRATTEPASKAEIEKEIQVTTNATNSEITEFITSGVVTSPVSAISPERKSGTLSNVQNTQNAYYLKMYSEFKAQYGDAVDQMIKIFKEKPGVIKTLFRNPNLTINEAMRFVQKYGTNRELMSEISKNPRIIDKLHAASATITTDQLTELAQLCTRRGADFVLELLEKYGALKTMTLANNAFTESRKQAIQNAVKKDTVTGEPLDNFRFQREILA